MPSTRLQHALQVPSINCNMNNDSNTPSLRKSPTSWKLANLVPHEDDDTMSTTSSEEDSSLWRLQKPPRHSSVPMCAQMLLSLWKRELRRHDVSITSDFFYDLQGSEAEAVYLVERMQEMGFHISPTQFFSLPRCSIYTILMVAL